ncbi:MULTISPECIES: glutamate synthase large subunit [Exiguobacterium]|uniref:glutamate synthase large subunit n=1 Tax=Exiguobacterium TaxID=33986 RepID=UPI0004797C6B|nr:MULTISPECIES: glutamate synthase large subunit [Exiguobacterium]MCT4780437.1 glutamate synthase large subunit [Exiguobacterium soli]
MSFHQMPQRQGLYDPKQEHDACGIGVYAHRTGQASHEIVQNALKMLCQMEHRGGQGSDAKTGDGAGILTQLPDRLFRQTLRNISLPQSGDYGVMMMFLPREDRLRQRLERALESIILSEGQRLIEWRTVPVSSTVIGEKARQTEPVIRQCFIEAKKVEGLAFERTLFLIRRLFEREADQLGIEQYVLSSSSETIVYKGLVTTDQLGLYFDDLRDERYQSGFAIVHSRFSTNTFPSWKRAHPNRYLIHNGEINTLQGNIRAMRSRENSLAKTTYGRRAEDVLPILDESGSDSSMLDNAFEFLYLSGLTLAETALMLVPEPFEHAEVRPAKRAYYEYHSSMMEPWDGPSAIVFTNGKQIGATLDRNGLRPARYMMMRDGHFMLSSESGVLPVAESDILFKRRLIPGELLLLDFASGQLISDEEVKRELAMRHPYAEWLAEERISLSTTVSSEEVDDVGTLQRLFGYTREDIDQYLIPLVVEKKDPLGAMGTDIPLAVLSERPQSLFRYFKQLFAQVTNPPIDALREQIVTSTMTWLGQQGELLTPNRRNCRRVRLASPILRPTEAAALKQTTLVQKTLSTLFDGQLEEALENLLDQAVHAVQSGCELLILSDRNVRPGAVPMPILLVTSAVHHHLIRQGLRTKVSLIIEGGEVREVHHFAALIGYGADAVHPYLVYATLQDALGETMTDYEVRYQAAVTEGVVKVMSKMGISTVFSYRGAQIFEAIGISEQVIDRYFTGTVSQLDGLSLDLIEQEAVRQHEEGIQRTYLESGSVFRYRHDGEHHAFNPATIHLLQHACRTGRYDLFKRYSAQIQEEPATFLRHLMTFKETAPIPIDEVEPVSTIVQHFKTGAMSYGSLSKEAHETLAIAMNRLGGKSNSGEGGEEEERYERDANGDSRMSRIKQIASGRFGVTSHYLVHADELQIKVAQGAKPGEGGQLPGEKVYPWIARVRASTPGVGLISPPPHHDIYSIEDLAQLIHDLKRANDHARISVKLVAKGGVGTIAAGVAKGLADVIVISGHDGGTGASPKTSIQHTGLPWELGLAETHQTLALNGLRDRVVLETDGKLLTGRDVVIAAMLGANEYGFATAPLIAVGCIMMRACHLDTCPVGVATQDPKLREKFTGTADHVVHFMEFVAEEVREYLAQLGVRSLSELVGRTDLLQTSDRLTTHWKAASLDLSRLFVMPDYQAAKRQDQQHHLSASFDGRELEPLVTDQSFTERQTYAFDITNTDRAIGTNTGARLSRIYGAMGLPADRLTLNLTGSAGQSLGAYLPRGMTLQVIGDANDYVGKGLSGGIISVRPQPRSSFVSSDQVIIGNVALYGATSGELYINGQAGERFAVRNSGATAVVEGIGNHGLEYMTGGSVVILGDVGLNFAAGMSGGVAYVLPKDPGRFRSRVNLELVTMGAVTDPEEATRLKTFIERHVARTNSEQGHAVLANWDHVLSSFIRVIPTTYQAVTTLMADYAQQGHNTEEAMLLAFETHIGRGTGGKK